MWSYLSLHNRLFGNGCHYLTMLGLYWPLRTGSLRREPMAGVNSGVFVLLLLLLFFVFIQAWCMTTQVPRQRHLPTLWYSKNNHNVLVGKQQVSTHPWQACQWRKLAVFWADILYYIMCFPYTERMLHALKFFLLCIAARYVHWVYLNVFQIVQ